MRILVLGGTGEARLLANALVEAGHEVITSLAGRTTDPLRPKGALRVGGFGGIPGLRAYLSANGVERLVDATHPYAGLISINAVAAARDAGVPLVRYMRAPWIEPAESPWLRVPSLAAAAERLPSGAVALVTTGHEGLDTLLDRDDCQLLVRVIERPRAELPGHARLLLSRPPHALADELDLLRREGITHLVSKNSGGSQTSAKLEAACQLGVAVIMVERPDYPPALEVDDIAAAIAALQLPAP